MGSESPTNVADIPQRSHQLLRHELPIGVPATKRRDRNRDQLLVDVVAQPVPVRGDGAKTGTARGGGKAAGKQDLVGAGDVTCSRLFIHTPAPAGRTSTRKRRRQKKPRTRGTQKKRQHATQGSMRPTNCNGETRITKQTHPFLL